MNQSNNQLHLAFSCDANYFPGLETAFASAVYSSRENTQAYEIFILDGGIHPNQRKQLQQLAHDLKTKYHLTINLQWFEPEHWSNPRINQCKHSPTFYARLLLADLLPDYDWVLWIDADILIQKDLSNIQNHLTATTPAVAAIDSLMPTLADELTYSQQFNTRNLDLTTPYINSGLCLLNLKLWRQENLIDKMLSWGDKYLQNSIFHDQSMLNWILADRIKHLDPSYNILITEPKLRFQDFKEPINLHFTGKFKPWKSPKKITPLTAASQLREIVPTYYYLQFRQRVMLRFEPDALHEFVTHIRALAKFSCSRKWLFISTVKRRLYQLINKKKRAAKWQSAYDFFTQEKETRNALITKTLADTEELIKECNKIKTPHHSLN